MSAFHSVVRLDLRGIQRDRVALVTVAMSMVGALIITTLGVFQHRLPGWSEWFPFMIAVSLVGGPSGIGFLFGLLMVEEGDTGVRDALTVSPIRPTALILIRTVVATAWMCVWPLASIYLMNSTWQAVDLSLAQWLTVVLPLALLTPGFALLIPTFARDKVGAVAVAKALSFVALIPLALYFVPEGAAYRWVFWLSPTGWVVEALRAFTVSPVSSGLLWGLGGVAYALALLVAAVHLFKRNVYRLHH